MMRQGDQGELYALCWLRAQGWKGRFAVTLCTRGGNQSWNGIVRRFSSTRCDHLYAHTACGRRWFIPADRVDGSTAITLGGPKYFEFEIEPGPAPTLS